MVGGAPSRTRMLRVPDQEAVEQFEGLAEIGTADDPSIVEDAQ